MPCGRRSWRIANHTILIWTSIWSPHCQGNTFLLQPCNVQYTRDGSRQLLAEGLHRIAGHILRTWLHELVFHLPQNLGCQWVEGHAQRCLQDACCHLSRTKARKDKLSSVTGKLYYLKANDTCFISTSPLRQSFPSTFFCKLGNPRPCSNHQPRAAPCWFVSPFVVLSFLEVSAQLWSLLLTRAKQA